MAAFSITYQGKDPAGESRESTQIHLVVMEDREQPFGRTSTDEIRIDSWNRRSLAQLAKREGDFNLACELWKGVLENSRQGYEAYEQLAIYYEHKARDPVQARQMVRQALDELCRANLRGDMALGPYHEIKERFDHRLSRLDRKIGWPC